MAPTVYLVTGANRGVGLYIVQELAKREDAIVFAGARNPAAANDLQDLVKSSRSKVHIVKLTSGNEEDLDNIVKCAKEVAGGLDVVIGNAGICDVLGPLLEMTAQNMRDHFEVNTIANFVLFQKTHPLLKESANPKFVVISAASGSLTIGAPMPGFTVYGASKAAVNYLTRKIHYECEVITSFSMCPGLVKSDMADFALKKYPALNNADGTQTLKTGPEASSAMMKVIDNATKEKNGGTFILYDGSTIPF